MSMTDPISDMLTRIRNGALDLRADQALDLGLAREVGEPAINDVARAGPVGHGVEVDLDQRGYVLAGVADHDRLADVGARAQHAFDVRGRERLAAGGHDEIARPVDEPQE